MLAATLISQQLVGNPDQTQATDEHQAGHLKQPDHTHRHHGAHANRADSAPDDRLFLQLCRQVARSKGDDDGVVAREDQINQDDRHQGGPPGGRKKFH